MKTYNIECTINETMEIEAENQAAAVEKFIEWLWQRGLSDTLSVKEAKL